MYYSKFDEFGNQTESVLSTENPGDDWYQLEEDIVGKRYKLIDGEVKKMTQSEIEEENDALLLDGYKKRTRDQRTRLLVESDWTTNPEVPLSEEKKAQWALYRQQLRDLPSSVTIELIKSGAELAWPTPPSN